MKRVRFVMVGGFLGAGKTTTIARLARHYVDCGLKVGLVTNDQAYDLVDTHSLRAQGFDVGEVPGACFCCKFNDLVETASKLSEAAQPDVIVAEPVGSCTDLVATVVEPLKHLFDAEYETAPFAVLLKPEHGQKILGGSNDVGFSPKAAYIFLKQIEEADVVVINKIDKLSDEERQRLLALVQDRFPGKEVLAMSARSGQGFDELVSALARPTPARERTMDVDYDTYAEGEAELGWLNCTATYTAEDAFALDELLLNLIGRLRVSLESQAAEPAHLKVLGLAEGETGIANLVGSGVEAELSLASHVRCRRAELIINARVATDPDRLTELVEIEARNLAAERGLECEIGNVQSFRPGRPVPTHRMTI